MNVKTVNGMRKVTVIYLFKILKNLHTYLPPPPRITFIITTLLLKVTIFLGCPQLRNRFCALAEGG
jgi:hypothetical protein